MIYKITVFLDQHRKSGGSRRRMKNYLSTALATFLKSAFIRYIDSDEPKRKEKQHNSGIIVPFQLSDDDLVKFIVTDVIFVKTTFRQTKFIDLDLASQVQIPSKC
ncbi:hypothetical protein RDI58_006164 [Solanum bulbocastanum]|uniref:Uncharacterized protein n=1 Tax=Solanum bulbocastanum TaxID=147425 RepID=A0AAN8YNB2_SOLBU